METTTTSCERRSDRRERGLNAALSRGSILQKDKDLTRAGVRQHWIPFFAPLTLHVAVAGATAGTIGLLDGAGQKRCWARNAEGVNPSFAVNRREK